MTYQKHNLTETAQPIPTWSIGTIAGLAGGGVEILWISIYMRLSGGEAAVVARGVTETLFPGFVPSAAAMPLGIAIHMGLAVILGIAISIFVRSILPAKAPAAIEPLAIIALLVSVWAVNFLVILPLINPAFVALVPFTTSLTSKVLFGVAAALALRFFDRPQSSCQKERPV